MKTTLLSRILKGALAAFLTTTLGGLAHAQATRTWVSGVGDDANPCSRTAPGKTFAGAISKTAAAGEINVLDPGGFGAVTITKSITIDGSGGSLAGVLVSGTNAIIINAAATDTVTLRNLDINGLNTGLNGINILQAGEVNIENCVIYGFTQKGVNIVTGASPVRVNIRHCIIRHCTSAGDGGAVLAGPGAGGAVLTISNSSLTNSLYGFKAKDGVKATLTDCVITGNSSNGVISVPTTTPTKVTVTNCVISDSGGNGVISTNANSIVRISANTIFNNLVGISAQSGGALISLGNNTIRGNTTDATAGTPTATETLQ
jgi:hypothetical protein